MTIPFRADQVGSLLRPPEVLAARDAPNHPIRFCDQRLRGRWVEQSIDVNEELNEALAADQACVQDSLALSPQCGFAPVAQGNLITSDDQRRKLELVVETVRGMWG